MYRIGFSRLFVERHNRQKRSAELALPSSKPRLRPAHRGLGLASLGHFVCGPERFASPWGTSSAQAQPEGFALQYVAQENRLC